MTTTEQKQQPAALVQKTSAESTSEHEQGMMQVFSSITSFESAQRMAKALYESSLVPDAYQKAKNPNAAANCLIALEMSNRIGASPLMVMQNLYTVHGQPSWSSKFLIATLNTCGRFTPIQYEMQNEDNLDRWRCRAWAIDKTTGAPLYGAWVSIEMAKAEGWYSKTGSKWKTMPELMLQYRAAAFFQRVYAPELSLGLHTKEELDDMQYAPYKDVSDDLPKFNARSLTTVEDVKKALLRGMIGKDEAEAIITNLTQQSAAQQIITASEDVNAPEVQAQANANPSGGTTLFPVDPPKAEMVYD